jgi:hypothetical protein
MRFSSSTSVLHAVAHYVLKALDDDPIVLQPDYERLR